ncbi:cation efflux protein [Rhizoclosmatium globosum]|uniref:Cation efflux protein n=1 Tax=Rhizoclosmatium globosum TaxID=329046 RepID=A0A1Y2BA25_9FUNG|nr:cation efflux protein [Rhizoclosmatium globosum]|eukprot:ORY30935.1 cation efflux protein [Rhizoclosmatium globosum]
MIPNTFASLSLTPKSKPLARAGLICFTFFLIQLATGLYCHSLAILSDSVHLFTDVIGYCVAVAAVEIGGTWGPTSTYTFGFARVELIGALISLFLTWNLCFGLIEEALNRFHEPQEINVVAMLVSAIFGVAANTFMAFTLQDPHDVLAVGESHNHHHHHHISDDDDACEKGTSSLHSSTSSLIPASPTSQTPPLTTTTSTQQQQPRQNINIQAALIHILGDILGSLSILLASLILLFKPTYTFVDPLCTILFACIIFASSVGLAREYVLILMETCPEGVKVGDVRGGVLEAVEGVVRVEECRVWSLTRGVECCVLVVVVREDAVEGVKGVRGRELKGGSAFMGLDGEQYSSEDVTTVVEMEESYELIDGGEERGHNALVARIREYLTREFGFHQVTIEIRLQ